MNTFALPPRRLLHRRAALGGLVGGLAIASGCAGIDPTQYAAEKPLLDLKQYFDGDIDAWGVFQDRGGKIVRRFTVKMKCGWTGDTGTAADVVGEAQGIASGNALNWKYVLALNVDGTTWNVDFDDWMYLVDERVMLNRATMSKFGVRLGEVLLSFTKR